MGYRVRKPDHTGAKNGGGHWGRRAEAKHESSRLRRLSWRSLKADWKRLVGDWGRP